VGSLTGLKLIAVSSWSTAPLACRANAQCLHDVVLGEGRVRLTGEGTEEILCLGALWLRCHEGGRTAQTFRGPGFFEGGAHREGA
jgi:hypothetical protein